MNPRIRTLGLVALLAVLLLGLGLPQPAAAAACTAVCYVDGTIGNDANDGDTAATAKKTIQAAVNQVTAGGQVIVAAGTYAQDVSVSKALTLTGAGPATTIIDPVNYVGISADNVTFEDIAISSGAHGARLSKSGSPLANTTFDNVHFKNNTNRGIDIVNLLHVTNLQVLNSLFEGNAAGIRMPSNATADGITIDNTTFQNQTGSGFYQANDNNVGWVKNLTVTGSTFTNLGTSGSGHAGVYAEEFSNVRIEDSTFTGNRYGLNLFDAYSVAASVTTNVIIRGNTFTDHKASTIAFRTTTSDPNAQLLLVEDNTINQNVSGAVGSFASVAVTTSGVNANGAVDVVDNTITFSGALPVGAATMYGIYAQGGLDDVRVEGNDVDGGGIANNGGTIPPSGVYVSTFSMKPAAVVLITKNELTNFVNGVSLHNGSAFGGVTSPDFDVIRNDLSGNTGFGIQSGPSMESDGTCNWWGAANGPSGQGAGSGTAVSTHVDFTPWLFTNNLDGPCFIGGTITIDKVAAGAGATEFEFAVSWSNDNVKLTDAAAPYVTTPPLPAGPYTISEVNLPAGWALDGAECVNGNVTAQPTAITLADGDAWVCTFTNKPLGTIEIAKSAPGGGSLEFEFDVSWSATNIKLSDGESETSPGLVEDTYAITEVNIPLYWMLNSSTCLNGTETAPASAIPVENGDEWVCTFNNVYAPSSTCQVNTATHQWTDLLGIGMGSAKAHKIQAKLNIPNSANLVELYGQMVAKSFGLAKQVRFIQPGKNNYVEVNTITSPEDNINGTFWYGADLPVTAATKSVTGKWWLQPSGAKAHIPRAFVLYPTYNDPANSYVNVWSTIDAAEGEVYWEVANGWTPYREIIVPITAPLGPETFHIELAVVDNDKDNRPVWVTVTTGGVTQTVKPTAPNKGDLLNLLVFDLANVPAGTDEIVIEMYSPSPALDGVYGESASLVGMTANYQCSPLNND